MLSLAAVVAAAGCPQVSVLKARDGAKGRGRTFCMCFDRLDEVGLESSDGMLPVHFRPPRERNITVTSTPFSKGHPCSQ